MIPSTDATVTAAVTTKHTKLRLCKTATWFHQFGITSYNIVPCTSFKVPKFSLKIQRNIQILKWIVKLMWIYVNKVLILWLKVDVYQINRNSMNFGEISPKEISIVGTRREREGDNDRRNRTAPPIWHYKIQHGSACGWNILSGGTIYPSTYITLKESGTLLSNIFQEPNTPRMNFH